ncbi:molybdopterin-guanine dinucleotide biosynthesis protein B [Desulfurivibrio sp. D14AmB]|uniref:molybdopterin-guanine dinucleotide biosynthesis protein B n=1 Tax=Desulfurivibrio sp. D14AmB TaxID=3374370 RepID=UPI00376F0FAF
MTPPVIALVGKPDCGKTTLLEKLLPELSRRGYRVGTIKHHVHEFAMDTPGKDTWRHKQAGAHTVMLSSPTGIGLVRDTDHDLGVEELVTRYFGELDLVLAEGYKRTALPKIEVYRRAIHPEPLPDRDDSWIALVSDIPLAGGLPCFSPDQVAAIADLLEQRFLPPAKLPMAAAPPAITLTVNGNPIPLNRFASAFLQRGILGMIASLRGCEDPQTIGISINNRPGNE